MSNTLRTTLTSLTESGSSANPVLNTLIADYTAYHLVLVIVGSLFVLALLALSLVAWHRFERAPKTVNGRSSLEKAIYLWFSLLGGIVALGLGLIVAINASTVLDARQGFSGSLAMLGTPSPGTHKDTVQRAFDAWLQSERGEIPATVRREIDARLAWQRPKAVICGVLLVLSSLLGARVWAAILRDARLHGTRRTLKSIALTSLGISTVGASLLLMVMVIGNAQGSLAPISLTLFLS